METPDGMGLRMVVWEPEGEPRGAILLTQGRTEYIEKAFEWIGKFRDRGLIVCAFDWRGQGLSQRELSGRERGFVRDFSDFQIDLDTVYQHFQARIGDLPMLIYGHSMGGLAATRFVYRRPEVAVATILSAPMLKLYLSPLTRMVAQLSARVLSALGFGARYVPECDDRTGADRGFEGNVLTQDRRRFDAHADMLDRYPDLRLGGVTWGWLRASFREIGAVSRLPKGWVKKPMLILRAGADEVVANEAIDRLAEENPSVEIVPLEGSRHEPLMELDSIQQVAWAQIDDFLDKVLEAQTFPDRNATA